MQVFSRRFHYFTEVLVGLGKHYISVQIGHQLYVFPNGRSIPLLSPNFPLFPPAPIPKD
jgi:hypothetical protein